MSRSSLRYLIAFLTALPATTLRAQTGATVQLEEIEIDGRTKADDPVRDPAVAPINGYVAKQSATGTKTSTPLTETPQSVSVVGSKQIRDLNVQTVDQALNYASGVKSAFFGADTRTDWFLIRGFPAQVSGYFLDGLQLFSPDFGTFKLEPFGMERIEVLKGPASVLYGGSSTGGIINAVSKRPPALPFGYVETGINNYGNKYAAFDVGGPVTPRADNQFYYRVEGYARGGGTQVNFQNDDRLYIAPSLTWAPDAATTVTFISSYQKDSTKGANFLPYEGTIVPAPFGRIPTSLFTSDPGIDHFKREQAFIGYSAEHKFNNNFAVRQNLRYSDLRIDSATVFGIGYDGPPANARLGRLYFSTNPHVTEFAVDNQAETRFDTGPLRHTMLAGVDYKHFTIADRQGFAFDPATLDLNLLNPVYGIKLPAISPFSFYKNVQDQLGEYLQEQAKFDRFTLVLSGRHDGLQTSFADYLTPANGRQSKDEAFTERAGLIYTSAIGLAPYATYATSFDPQLGINISSKQPLVPMTGQLYEIGAKYEPFGPNLLVNAALFNLTQQNVLTTDPNLVIGSIQSGEQRSRGFEIETAASLAEGLKVLGSFTAYRLQITKDLNPAIIGNLPTRIPQVFGALYLDYTIQTGPLRGLGAGAGARYTGSSFADQANTLRVPDYMLADAGLHYGRDHWRAALNVRNLFDETYVASCSSASACFYGERRTALVSLAYNW